MNDSSDVAPGVVIVRVIRIAGVIVKETKTGRPERRREEPRRRIWKRSVIRVIVDALIGGCRGSLGFSPFIRSLPLYFSKLSHKEFSIDL